MERIRRFALFTAGLIAFGVTAPAQQSAPATRPGAATEPSVRSEVVVRQSGQTVVISSTDQQLITQLAISLAESSSYTNYVTNGTKGQWDDYLADDHVLVHFIDAYSMAIGHDQLKAAEILIPFEGTSWPAYILVREGDAVHAYSKYHSNFVDDLRKVIRAARSH